MERLKEGRGGGVHGRTCYIVRICQFGEGDDADGGNDAYAGETLCKPPNFGHGEKIPRGSIHSWRWWGEKGN